jgi:hypothetical protein
MKRTLLLGTLAAATVGFTAGTMLHPISLPARPALATATVSAVPKPLVTTASAMAGRCLRTVGGEKTACYEGDLLPLVAARGAGAALDVLEQLVPIDADVRMNAHAFAHAIGVTAFETHPDVEVTFPACREEFQSGCYHGVIQAYFMRAGGDDSTTVRAVCAPWRIPGEYGWLRFQCAHGLGHGLTMMLDHDLPGALGRCDFLDDDWDRESCYGGAFMENVMDATQPHEAMLMPHTAAVYPPGGARFKEFDPANPAYPCSILAERYLLSCWENQISIILSIYNENIARSSGGCDRAPAAYVPWCYIGLGTDINGRVVSNLDSALVLCDSTPARNRAWCYVGVAKNRVEVGAQAKRGIEFCTRVPGRVEKMRCYEAVGEEISSVSARAPDREAMCRDVDVPYREACRFGARLMVDRPKSLPPAL